MDNLAVNIPLFTIFFPIYILFFLRYRKDMEKVILMVHEEEIKTIDSDFMRSKSKKRETSFADISIGIKRVFRADRKVFWRMFSLKIAKIFSLSVIIIFIFNIVISLIFPNLFNITVFKYFRQIGVLLSGMTIITYCYIGNWYFAIRKTKKPND